MNLREAVQQLADELATERDEMDASTAHVLRALYDIRSAVDVVIAEQVSVARGMGDSWQQIAEALNVSRQSAHEKYSAGALRQ